MRKLILTQLFLWMCGISFAQVVFPTLDSLLLYTKQKSVSIQNSHFKLTYAKKARLIALGSIVSPSSSVSFNYTNNTQLPVNVFPADAFGGTPGTFREVQTGIQYTSNFNTQAEFNLLNVQTWQNAHLAKLNLETTETDNKLNEKKLYENIATAYYNIVQLQEQQKTAFQTMSASDTLYKLALNKYTSGNTRVQDVNDSKVTYIESKESYHQLRYLLQQQYLSLKVLCDIPENDSIYISETYNNYLIRNTTVFRNDLSIDNSLKQQKYALANLRHTQYANIPSISLFASNSFQQFNTKNILLDKNVNWIQSNYIGFKLYIPILPTASSFSQMAKAKYEYQVAQKNTEHVKREAAINYQQLLTEMNKAVSQALSQKEIADLRKETYQKNLDLYAAGIIGIDQTIKSFNAKVNSEYSYISANINVMLVDSKIEINNKIK
jgi:outer membrane protein TolC